MRYFILILLSFTLFAEDKAKPQPPEVINALAAYEKALVEARKEYEAKEARIRTEALRKLEEAKRSYARKEDLEGGMLCQEAAKKLNEGDVMTAVEDRYLKNKSVILGVGLEIISAKFGADTRMMDMTDFIKSKVVNGYLYFINDQNEHLKLTDVAPNARKGFTITYRLNGKLMTKTFLRDIPIEIGEKK